MNLFALALVINALIGWPIWLSIVVSAAFVLAYITARRVVGRDLQRSAAVLRDHRRARPARDHRLEGRRRLGRPAGQDQQPEFFNSWSGTHVGTWSNPLGDWIGIIMGLGFVLSFGYWTTNFAEVQRALSAKDLSAAQRTPLIGSFPKIFIPALTIIPGLIAVAVLPKIGYAERRLQQRDPGADEQVPAERHARRRARRAAGRVHGRHGRQRELVQHGVHLRHLADLHRQGPPRRLLPERRPGRHGRRDRDRYRHCVHRAGLHEHHELHPVAVRVLQCAVVRDVHHRDVLEAGIAVGGGLRPRGRHTRRRSHALRGLRHRLLLPRRPRHVARRRSTRRWRTSTARSSPSSPMPW